MTDRNDYAVGYGKPPQHSRFRKGRSGNPKGRPKGAKNLKTDLLEELQERVLVTEGQRCKRLSKQRAVIKSLTARAIKGDVRATNTLLALMAKLLDIDGLDQQETPLTGDEAAILMEFERQILQKAKSPPPSSPSTPPQKRLEAQPDD